MALLKKYLAENDKLIHSTMQKVESHVQRQVGIWLHNTILLEGYDVPFKYYTHNHSICSFQNES